MDCSNLTCTNGSLAKSTLGVSFNGDNISYDLTNHKNSFMNNSASSLRSLVNFESSIMNEPFNKCRGNMKVKGVYQNKKINEVEIFFREKKINLLKIQQII